MREGLQVTALTRWLVSECEGNFNHVQLASLLPAPEMLTMLDPPTLTVSPWYEVPTRPHTVWCGSPIRYDGPVTIVLRICLNSCLSAHERGSLCLRDVRSTCQVNVSVIVLMVLSV